MKIKPIAALVDLAIKLIIQIESAKLLLFESIKQALHLELVDYIFNNTMSINESDAEL
jgi:hypothetical protein